MRKQNYFNMLSESDEQNAISDSQSFGLMQLNSIRSFNGRVAYCRKFLKFLGRGSSRIVFQMANGHALKLAWNGKGLAQNEAEGGDYYKNSLSCFTNCFNCADDYTWIESELARKCSPSEFQRINGFSFNKMQEIIIILARQCGSGDEYYWKNIENPEETKKMVADMCEDCDSLVYSINEYIGNYGMSNMIADLLRITNWGIVNRNGTDETVIVDSGINEDIYNQYYRRKLT